MRKTMETKREALGDTDAARELAEDIAEMPHAPNGDPQHEPELDDDDQEPDGRWVFSTEAGCWLYE